MRIGESK